MINYGRHFIDGADISAVIKVLQSNFLTTGPVVKEFEEKLQEFTGFKYAIAVNSGTAALHGAMYAIDCREGDEIILPSITFVATANSVCYTGADPVIADVNPDTILIDENSVDSMITRKTKAVIAVDYAGQQCDYKKLKELCNNNNLYLIADACHSFGAIRADNYDASNYLPHMVCYSFHPVKHITTGEGGAVLTNNCELAKRVRAFRDNGRVNGNAVDPGYNYKMPDINAALGISQLDKIDRFQTRRNFLAQKYQTIIGEYALTKVNRHVYHLFVLLVENRAKFIDYMLKKDINCVIHYKPVYEQLYFMRNFVFYIQRNKLYRQTEEIKNKLVSIPLYYGLSDMKQDYIIETIMRYM